MRFLFYAVAAVSILHSVSTEPIKQLSRTITTTVAAATTTTTVAPATTVAATKTPAPTVTTTPVSTAQCPTAATNEILCNNQPQYNSMVTGPTGNGVYCTNFDNNGNIVVAFGPSSSNPTYAAAGTTSSWPILPYTQLSCADGVWTFVTVNKNQSQAGLYLSNSDSIFAPYGVGVDTQVSPAVYGVWVGQEQQGTAPVTTAPTTTPTSTGSIPTPYTSCPSIGAEDVFCNGVSIVATAQAAINTCAVCPADSNGNRVVQYGTSFTVFATDAKSLPPQSVHTDTTCGVTTVVFDTATTGNHEGIQVTSSASDAWFGGAQPSTSLGGSLNSFNGVYFCFNN